MGAGAYTPLRMEWVSHTATGFFLGQILVKEEERPRRAGWWWTIAAICPDWLEFATRWFGDIHRGVTHSLYMWPILALLWAMAARRWGGDRVASLSRLWTAFFVIIGSHLLLDVFMPYRLYLAWPFVQTRWAWDIMPLYDVYIFAGWLILYAVKRWKKLPSLTTARLGLAIFLLVFSMRVGGKLRATSIAGQLTASAPLVTAIRTLPAYYQPWVWYVRLSDDLPQWTPINVLTGDSVPEDQMISPWFPRLPGREHVKRPASGRYR